MAVRAPAEEGGVVAVEAPEAILLEDDARAYRRFVDWSIGHGFKLAILEVANPRQRAALAEWTQSAAPGARVVAIEEAAEDSLRAVLGRAAGPGEETSMLVLTGLEKASNMSRVCAKLNVQRDEMAKAFPVPWALVIHPATSLALQQQAPDFCDFAAAWMRGLEGPAPMRPALGRAMAIPAGRVPRTELSSLLERASLAVNRGLLDEARDLLAQHDLMRSDVHEDPIRVYVAAQLLLKEGKIDKATALFEQALAIGNDIEDPRIIELASSALGELRGTPES